MTSALFIVFLAASPFAGLCAEGNAGVQKVIQMLGDMSAKVKHEKNEEQVMFAEFDTWCKMEIPQTQKSIAKAAESIDLLNEEIGKLQADVAQFESEKKAATAQREKDNAAYNE